MWPQGECNSLDEEFALLCDGMWTPQRRLRVRGPATRMLQLVRSIGGTAADAPAAPWDRFAAVYARRRLDLPLDAWRRPVLPATVCSELSCMAEATRLDMMSTTAPPVPPYLGHQVKAYLAFRGAFEKPGHTRSFPITPADLWAVREIVPPQYVPAWKAAVVVSFFAFRGRFVLRVAAEDFETKVPEDIPSLPPAFSVDIPVVEMWWSKQTKVKRGDRLQGREASIRAPQFARVQSAFFWSVFRTLPEIGLLFPTLTAAQLMAFISWLVPRPPPGYRLAIHGIRAGTATVLAAIRAPVDVMRAWGWWSDPAGTEVHYAAFVTAAMRAASAILHLVQVRRLRPGFVEFQGLNADVDLPRWTRLATAARGTGTEAQPRLGVVPPRLAEASDSSSEDQAVVVPLGLLDLGRGGRQTAALRSIPRVAIPPAGLVPQAAARSLHTQALAGLADQRRRGQGVSAAGAGAPTVSGTGGCDAAGGCSPGVAGPSPSPAALRAPSRASRPSDATVSPGPALGSPPARAPVALFGSALRVHSLSSGAARGSRRVVASPDDEPRDPRYDTRDLPPCPDGDEVESF